MISFEIRNLLLILVYSYENGNDWVNDKLVRYGEVTIGKVFEFKNEDVFNRDQIHDNGDDDSVRFIFGNIEGSYFKIDGRKLLIRQNVFIDKNIVISKELFLAVEGISVFIHLSKIVPTDIYIGGDNNPSIPSDEFLNLINSFPNAYELQKYSEARLSAILKNYFDLSDDREEKYRSYMNKKESMRGDDINSIFREVDLEKYKIISKKLEEMLVNKDQYNERQWQNEIVQIILLLYPKYIQVFKDTMVKDDENRDKELDFLLLDVTGNVDIIEIKQPFDECIITKGKYRDNHIPLRELSGTVMQVEKYIYYLNRWGKRGEDALTIKYSDKLPSDFKVKITNPNGFIIMGRDSMLNPNQRRDFEVVRRKYKNIIDIITYDDLLQRLSFIIKQLEPAQTHN